MTPTFDHLLDHTLRSRTAEPPRGLEQRLLAHLANADAARATPPLFSTSERVRVRRSALSSAFALGLHAAGVVLVFALAHRALSTHDALHTQFAAVELTPPPPPLASHADAAHGGGGQTGLTAASQGHLPKFAAEQLLPPKAPPLDAPKLPVEPTVKVQTDLRMADNTMPNLGVPNSALSGSSFGHGRGNGMGSGDGDGLGPGSGTNTGGGPMHVGGLVREPVVLYSVEPEFSEEARKAKFSGNVQVYLWVDEHGNPSHVRIARGIGMGLDEKAMEAVRQYKFKPATLNGKPVKVDLYVDVFFTIM